METDLKSAAYKYSSSFTHLIPAQVQYLNGVVRTCVYNTHHNIDDSAFAWYNIAYTLYCSSVATALFTRLYFIYHFPW